jgi:signal transduction histidine kinase
VAERKPWNSIFRLLERDERVFAVLLAVVMVGGLATLGLAPLRPRYRFDIFSLVQWFALYKAGILALVTINPRATGRIFSAALAVDLMLIFGLIYLTGGGDSPFVNLFYPLVAVNAYYFGRWMGLGLTLVMGLLYWTAAWLATPLAAWTAVVILMGQVGLPAFALGHVADRERRARADVERLNAELTGTLGRLQTAQQELLVAERMATVGRLSLKVAHEVRNPIAAIELNAEILQDIVRGDTATDQAEAVGLVSAIRDQVNALDALTEEYLAFARFPKPHFEEESINHLLGEGPELVRPGADARGRRRSERAADGDRPHAAASGHPQSGQERPGGIVARRLTFSLQSPRWGIREDLRVGQRTGDQPGSGGALVRAVLHDEATGHRARPLDRASDHRGARR